MADPKKTETTETKNLTSTGELKHSDDVEFYRNISNIDQGVNVPSGDYKVCPAGSLIHKRFIGARMAAILPWITPYKGDVKLFDGIVIQ